MDALARIERQYGCVTEYNRCMAEGDSRIWEGQQKAAERYAENCRQIEEHRKAGHLQMADAFVHPEQCDSCKKRTGEFPTDENDDIGLFFCLNADCIHRKNETKEDLKWM